MAQKILELSDEAKTQFQQWSPTTVLATTEFEEGKNEYWDWQPLTISPEQKTDFKALLQSRYRQIVTANLKYIEPFEVISQLSRQLKNTSQTNEMEILIGLMWRNFLLSPSFH